MDENADDDQRRAIDELVGGEHGGPWGILAWTWPTVRGPLPVPYEIELDGVRSHVKAGAAVALESGPIRNPVTGAESYPSLVLPQGIIFKAGDCGASATFRVADGIQYDHSGQYTAIGRFDYSGE